MTKRQSQVDYLDSIFHISERALGNSLNCSILGIIIAQLKHNISFAYTCCTTCL